MVQIAGNGRCRGNSDDSESGRGRGKGSNRGQQSVASSFTFRELATATKGFREVNLIGERGFGRVYKGRLDAGKGNRFAIQLSRTALQSRAAHNQVSLLQLQFGLGPSSRSIYAQEQIDDVQEEWAEFVFQWV